MTESFVVSIMLEAMRVTTLLAAPMLLGALITGLVISIFQAVTQIQEQTLTFVPKMIVVFLVIALTFAWMSKLLIEMTASMWQLIPDLSK